LLWAAVAGPIDITRALLAGVLLMLALIGNVLGKVRRNFWIGVRTPWTLANERVWNDTNRLAGRLFVAAAVVGLPLLLLPLHQLALTIVVFILIMTRSIRWFFTNAWSAAERFNLEIRGDRLTTAHGVCLLRWRSHCSLSRRPI